MKRTRGAASSKPAPAGGVPQPKATRNRRTYHKEVEDTPMRATDKERPADLPRQLLKMVGLRRCAVGCMIGPPWLVQGIHIVTRTLKDSHPHIYRRFADCIGILDPKTGQKEIYLDGTGNYEWAHHSLHQLFDGRSVQGKAYGGGGWAFRPKNIRGVVAHLKANRGANYKQLYPRGAYEVTVYGFPCEHQHVYGRYSDDARTYIHLQDPGSKQWSKDDILEWYMQSQERHGPVEMRILQVGDQGFVIISHMNPVFITFDYALKMKYRLIDNPELGVDIPKEDRDFFREELWPVVQPWFEDPSALFEDSSESEPGFVVRERSHTTTSSRIAGVQSEGATRVDPVTPPMRAFHSAPGDVPVERDSSPPAEIEHEAIAVAEVQQHTLFGGPPAYESEKRYRYASSDAGVSVASDLSESSDGMSSNSTATGFSGSGPVATFSDDYDFDVDSEYGADECDPDYDDCDHADDGEPEAEDDHVATTILHSSGFDLRSDDVEEHGHAAFYDSLDDLYARRKPQRAMSESPCPAGPMHADDPTSGDDSDGESIATIRDERDADTFALVNASDQEPPPSDEPPAIPPVRTTAQVMSTALPALSTSQLKKPAASKKSKKIVHFSREDEDDPGQLEEHSDDIKNQSAPFSTSASSSKSGPSFSSTTTIESPSIELHPTTTSEPPPGDSPPEQRRSARVKQPPKPPGVVHAPPPNASSRANRPKRTGKATKAATTRTAAAASASSSNDRGPDQPRPPTKPRGRKRTRDDRNADDDQDGIGDQVEDDEDADESDDVESVHSEYLPPAKRVKRTKAAAKCKGKPDK
ncbi:hypothetical protein K523DRAFT_380936 [Schizophyllum commune Tattone D]|nr:hypothetical protein K523DRAFT_380936 [Schizophyllum commune Tattone D]